MVNLGPEHPECGISDQVAVPGCTGNYISTNNENICLYFSSPQGPSKTGMKSAV